MTNATVTWLASARAVLRGAGGDPGGLGEQFLGVVEEGCSGGDQAQHAVVAVEQLGIEEGFQALQLLAGRWLADVQAPHRAADVALFGHRHEGPEQPQVHIDIHSATLSTESESVLDGPPAGGPDFGYAPASPSRQPAGRGTTRMGQAFRLRRRPPGMTRRYQAGCAAALPRKAACRTRHGWRLRP
jgi:hypothetical protein